MTTAKLQTVNLRKEYPGTVALDDVSVRFEGGKVNALIGKNGAGKSTLVRLLAGAERPTAGEILVDGQTVCLRSPGDAFHQRIATVYQELSLVPHLSVAENILLGRLPRKSGAIKRCVIDWDKAHRRAQGILTDMQVDLDTRAPASGLSVAEQQVVEIAKGMSFDPAVVMLDEPTSALAQHETERLFALIRRLAERGVAIIYISHRLQELPRIADTVTVLRDGRFIDSVPIDQATPQRIIEMMFGQVVPRHRPDDLKPGGDTVLEVRNLNKADAFQDISFSLKRGEVLGIAGMLGVGRTELLKAIFGVDPPDSGEIQVGDHVTTAPTPEKMKTLGLAFTPEDRKTEALVQVLSISANMWLAGLSSVGGLGLLTGGTERRTAQKLADELQIKLSDIDAPVSSLSGGNQQKVVVGNWLNTSPRIILFDEPTRGIDVQAKQQIFQIAWELSRRGVGTVFVSTELEELVEVCHRILVMKSGRLVDEVNPDAITADELYVKCMEK